MGRIGQPFRGGGELFFSGAKHYSETQSVSHFTTASSKVGIFARAAAVAQRFIATSGKRVVSDRTSAITLAFSTIAERIKGHNAPSAVIQQSVVTEQFNMAANRSAAVVEVQRTRAAFQTSFVQSALGILRQVADEVALFWPQNRDFKVDYLEIARNAVYGEYPEGGTTTEDGTATVSDDSTTMSFQDDGVGSYQEGYNRIYGGEFQ